MCNNSRVIKAILLDGRVTQINCFRWIGVVWGRWHQLAQCRFWPAPSRNIPHFPNVKDASLSLSLSLLSSEGANQFSTCNFKWWTNGWMDGWMYFVVDRKDDGCSLHWNLHIGWENPSLLCAHLLIGCLICFSALVCALYWRSTWSRVKSRKNLGDFEICSPSPWDLRTGTTTNEKDRQK